MQNYSDVFAATLAEFQSLIVPADQGDAGKGQVTARAVYTINTTRNANVGYISKSPGQTQYHGIAVDACQDKSDGTGADYLTDVDLGNGTREIRLAYTAYGGAASPPDLGWQQPTPDMLEHGGPLVLKAVTTPGPEPAPADDTAVLERIDQLEATLLARIDQLELTLSTQANANTQRIQDQIAHVVEQFEETALDIAMLLILKDRPGSKAEQDARLHAIARRIDSRQRQGG